MADVYTMLLGELQLLVAHTSGVTSGKVNSTARSMGRHPDAPARKSGELPPPPPPPLGPGTCPGVGPAAGPAAPCCWIMATKLGAVKFANGEMKLAGIVGVL